ncbi:hypothetical protein BH10BAC4_BH10BAC4_03040 [soil metagenome]
MKFLLLFFILVLPGLCVVAQKAEKVTAFSFMAIGDMPYFVPDDYSRFDNVIREINKVKISFTIHVGDFKSSKMICSDEYYGRMVRYFQSFKKPLIYTPGDNEWTDCNKPEAGSYNSQERLAVIRKMFFPERKNFGKEKIVLISQAENPLYKRFVENNRWEMNGIQFATLHVVGTNNNKLPDQPERMAEFEERDKANIAWLEEVFKLASQSAKAGIVIAMQADMFNEEKGIIGFETLIQKLTALSIAFGKPVLLVNGDSHKFIVDKPLLRERDIKIEKQRVVENFTRLQLFGEQDMHAVKIVVDPGFSGLFRIEQLMIQGN